MSNPLAALEGYPKEGPEVPDREKVKREKDRHESGTGRRDREKRGGKGPANWGDPIKDQLAAEADADEDVPEEQGQQESGEKKNYTAPDFGDDDDEEEAKHAPKVVKVPPRFAGMVKTGDGEEVVVEEPDFSNAPKPKQAKPAKPKHSEYKPEPEPEKKVEPEEDEVQSGKKGRNQSHQAVQHNRTSNNQAHAPKGNFH